ncbi:MAG: wax ester/triacylglycerol synthase family O-acyltransferase [Alphaproteobacteria bacterium]
MERLSAVDASFLYAEKPEMPLHVGGITVLEPREEDREGFFNIVAENLKQRMLDIPQMRWRVAEQPFNLDYPIWVEDPDLDWDYHLVHETLPAPGTMKQLYERVGELHMELLDRSRPLFRQYIFDGLEDGNVAMYFKVHHSCMDGQMSTQMATVMMDLDQNGRAPLSDEQKELLGLNRKAAKLEPNLLTAVIDGVSSRLRRPLLRQMPALVQSGVAAARTFSTSSGKSDDEGNDKPKEPKAKMPVTRFNGAVSNTRSLAGDVIEFDKLKTIKKAAGVTINDAVVAITGGALRRYLDEKGELPQEGSLVCGAPVALKQSGGSNNNLSIMTMSFRTDIADPIERLQAVAQSARDGKEKSAKMTEAMMGTPTGRADGPGGTTGFRLPSTIVKPMARLIANKNVMGNVPPVMHAVLSNVPGPNIPLYFAGARIVSNLPVSVVTHSALLNITMASLNGEMLVGVIACGKAVPDPEHLVALIIDECDVLLAALSGEPKPEGKAPAAANDDSAKVA